MSDHSDDQTPVLGYLVPEFPNQTHAFFWRELSALRDAGVDLHILSTRRPPDSACPHAFAKDARQQTAYLFPPRIGAALGALIKRPAGLLRAMRYVAGLRESNLVAKLKVLAMVPIAADFVQRAKDIRMTHLHVHSCANAAHIAALAHALDGLPYSLTLHGHLPVYGTDHVSKFRKARFVSTVTRPLQADVRALAPALSVPVVSMGVDTDRFAPSTHPRHGDGPITFISIARLNYVKGHVHFLRVLRRLLDEGHEVHYNIAGDGHYEPEIREEIARLSLGDHVTLLGPIGEPQVIQELHRADVFVLTSFGQGEAAPVAVMEAMSTALPVICSRIGGTGDMINHGQDGLLVAQQDEDDIYAAAHQLVTDAAFRSKIGQTARARALQQFDYRAQAQQLLQAIRAK